MTRPNRKRTHTALSVGQLEEGQIVEARYGEHVNENEPPRNVFQRTTSAQLEVCQRVEARYQGKSHAWHPGVVQHINEDGTLAIDFDDGDQEARVKRKHVRPPKTEAPPPSTPTYAETKRGRLVFEVNRLRASWANQYDGKRGSITQKTMESKPKRTPQGRGSLSCVQDLSAKMCSAGGPLPQPSFEEEQVVVEVGLFDSRIRVYWTGEEAWYAGRVISVGRGVGGILHTVAYDDGEWQPHYLQSAESYLNERWELEPSPECKTPSVSAAALAGVQASELSPMVGWCDEWLSSSTSTSTSASASASDCGDCGDSDDAAGVVSGWGESEAEAEEDE